MTDFAGYRALFLDCGVDPRAVGDMSLAELSTMLDALGKRRGVEKVPSEEERKAAMAKFMESISGDPSVRIQ